MEGQRACAREEGTTKSIGAKWRRDLKEGHSITFVIISFGSEFSGDRIVAFNAQLQARGRILCTALHGSFVVVIDGYWGGGEG